VSETDLGDPTGWTDRERAIFAAGWNECLKMQPGENERLRAAMTQIASVANHGVNHPGEALDRVATLATSHQQHTQEGAK
jgi:hypothetical protein